jgi:TatD DNase family protein
MLHIILLRHDVRLRLMEEFPNAYFGFTGLLTFPDTERLRDAVRVIPLDRILLVHPLNHH